MAKKEAFDPLMAQLHDCRWEYFRGNVDDVQPSEHCTHSNVQMVSLWTKKRPKISKRIMAPTTP